MRIVVEVKRDGSPQHGHAAALQHTQLQTSFNANMLALVDGQPQTLGLKKMLEHYITYQRDVVRRRTEFDLRGHRSAPTSSRASRSPSTTSTR